ncbi:hypothetical protein AB0J28_26945 [Streptosporangium canum]
MTDAISVAEPVTTSGSDVELLVFPTEHLKKEHDVRVHGSRAAPGRP